ncbi:S1 RNA-binding domain-containing protein [Desulfohalobiaceae bacterium Ax17]|nr:S1 RNA-binding domain-containing protein [Desulfovulcanus ferrireducens]
MEVPNRYPVGTAVVGKITNITDFGLFVEVEEGIEGLVHVSEMSRKKIKNPKEVFQEGQDIQAKVIHVSADERRLGLSIKQFQEEEEKKRAQDFKNKSGSAAGSNLGELIRQKLEQEDGE